MTTKETITPKNRLGKQKTGEIFRLQKLMSVKNLQAADVARDTGVSVRTITHSLYDGTPLGGKLLRCLHQFYGVSIDWLLSGDGPMFCAQNLEVSENACDYLTDNARTLRIIQFIRDWMSYASEDEQAWLETELKFKIKQYQQFLDQSDHGD